MICDFCSAPNPRWRYPASDVQVAPGAMSESDWLACDQCAYCIRSNDWEMLARRSLETRNARMLRDAGMSDSQILAHIAIVHRAFRHARIGGVPVEVHQ